MSIDYLRLGLRNMLDNENIDDLPISINLQIRVTIMAWPDKAHLFKWGHGNLVLVKCDDTINIVKAITKDVKYLEKYECINSEAKNIGAIIHTLRYDGDTFHRSTGFGRRSPYDHFLEEGPRYYRYKQHDQWVISKRNTPIAADIKTHQKYYYRKVCDNCRRSFYSTRVDARYCKMRTCQKRKINPVIPLQS